MKLSADITGQTLYIQRLTRNGSIQLTTDPNKAMELNRHELPEAISRLNQEYQATNIKTTL